MGAKIRKGKRKRSLGKFVLLGINALCVLLLCLSYLAPYIDPQSFWPLAFFGLGYPIFLLANLVFIILWALKKSKYLILSLLCILCGYVPLKKHIGFRSKPDEASIKRPDSSSIRVLTYNVHLFRKEDQDVRPKTKTAVTELILSVSPDIVCMQEFYTRKKGKYNSRQNMAPALGLSYSYFHPVVENEYEAYGLIILSRYPIKNAGSIPNYQGKRTLNRAIYADIVKNGRAFRVYNIHLQSIGFQPQDYAFVKDVKSRSFENDNVASTKRIGSRLKHAFFERSEQAKRIKEEINRCRKPVIITGDFNDTPLSFAVHTVSSDLNNSFEKKGAGWGITYNGEFPNFQIDYILSSKTFEVKHYQILKKKLSDHYAVWSDLAL
ncbi:endonuclease/exonuclease/phosphatase family protein [Olivibacter sp. SA151]|uniref:endonuclease/exonuclease/phosphatase family protein n=1 Tax=Olivibacter jilunii TaxID=985016 RepID=UPI003F192AC6